MATEKPLEMEVPSGEVIELNGAAARGAAQGQVE